MGDNPWSYVFLLIALAVLVILVLSASVSLMVSFAARRYSDRIRNSYQRKITALLPGDDCGACGCPCCRDFALAVLLCGESAGLCPKIDETAGEKIADAVTELQKQIEANKK